MNPINLKELYGDKYKIDFDPSAKTIDEKNDPFNYLISCEHGNIYHYSDRMLGYNCNGTIVRNKLHRDHKEIEVINWSDDGEAIFLFKPEEFDLIKSYAKPKRKRKLSRFHKECLIKAGSDALEKYKKSNSESSNSDQDSTQKDVLVWLHEKEKNGKNWH